MKLDNVKRIIVEDFKDEDREVVSKLAYIINNYFEQIYNLTNNKIDFDNLNREVVTLKVTVDANGVPTKQTTFSTKVVSSPKGANIISSYNPNNPTLFPVSCPFICFTSLSSGLFRITKVLGLEANKEYVLKAEIIG